MTSNALADTPQQRIQGDYSFSFYAEDDLDAGKAVQRTIGVRSR